jgi:hypothetical protein
MQTRKVKVEVEKLKPGPIQHEQLTEDQIKRIKRLHKLFAAFDGSSLDEWILDFRRDIDPDKEIRLWERIARVYEQFCARRKSLSYESKVEVYNLLLWRTTMSEEEFLSTASTNALSYEELTELMKSYRAF